ncbi:MAG: M20/M25/M40 family metallo-hydrolase [Gemmatimonadaceae bacterium]|nr:M20/M25/M40 family metallo-hydrolase [Gemmatimonadaceae bacterium]
MHRVSPVRPAFGSVAVLFTLACASVGPPASLGVSVPNASAPTIPADTTRPRVEIATTTRFDPASAGVYAGTHPETYAHIDAHLAEHVEHLRRWVRQPSISAENRGIRQMAELLRDDLRKLGFKEAELVPTSGHPGVWGFYDAGAPTTLAIYMMYDVQPVEPAGWSVPAFDGAIVDHPLGKVLMARGAINQKGPERAFLNAIESIIATKGKLPVNLMVVAEGEEELGSLHYPEIIDKYESRLRQASGVFFPFLSQGASADVTMFLGVKGIVYFEVEARGNARGGPKTAEIHGSYKAITDSPVWRLTQALASLTSRDGNTILVPGYYQAIRPPNAEEQQLANTMADQWTKAEPAMRAGFGVDRWADGVSGRASLADYLFSTTLNIDGIWSGYTGVGMKTILPHVATAKLDSRLVPNQTPDEALRLIRAHLNAKGFTEVVVRKLSGYPPAQTSVTAPLVRAALSVYNKYGYPTSVAPRLAGSAPYYVFTDRLKLPLVAGGVGHGSGAHAPNEFMVVEPKAGSKIAGLADVEKFYVDLLYALAEMR